MRSNAQSVGVLRVQAEAQFASHDYANAVVTLDTALALMPDDVVLQAVSPLSDGELCR